MGRCFGLTYQNNATKIETSHEKIRILSRSLSRSSHLEKSPISTMYIHGEDRKSALRNFAILAM